MRDRTRWSGSLGRGGIIRVAWLALPLLLFGPPSLAGQVSSLSLAWPASADLHPEPGATLTVPLLISNASAQAESLTIEADVPAGWRIVTGTEALELAARSTSLRILGIHVPVDAPAGPQAIRVRVFSRIRLAAAVEDTLALEVPARAGLAIEWREPHSVAPAGRPHPVSVLVHNRGNVPLAPVLEWRTRGLVSQDLPSQLDTIPPGAFVSVTGIVTPPTDPRPGLPASIELAARTEPGSAESVSATATLEVLPVGTVGTASTWHSVPFRLRISSGGPGSPSVPFELSGSGRLFDRGPGRIEVLARGPRVPHPMMGDQDEYRVALTGERFAVRVGDQIFRLSSLTEPSRQGFGVQTEFGFGAWDLLGYHATDRRLDGPGQQGVALARSFERGRLALQLLNGAGVAGDLLASVRGSTSLIPGATLEGEYGRAPWGNGASGGSGAFVSLLGQYPRLSYNAQVRWTDPDYAGWGAGRRHLVGGVAFRPTPRLRLHANGRHLSRQAPTREGTGSTRVESRGLAVGFSIGTRISLEHRWELRDAEVDEGSAPPLLRSIHPVESRFLRASTGASLGRVWTRGYADLGRNRSLEEGTTLPFHRAGLEARLSTRSGVSVSTRLEHLQGRLLSVEDTRNGITLQFVGSQRLGGSTQAGLSFTRTWSRDGEGPGYQRVEGHLSRTLPRGHEIDARVRMVWNPSAWENPEPSFVVRYAIPFRVPVTRSRTSGEVAVHVTDPTTGTGLAHTRVRLGEASGLTDSGGRVRFTALEPGAYRVELDRGSTGIGRLPEDPTALEVQVEPGRKARADVLLVEGGTVSGTVGLYTSPTVLPSGDGEVEWERISGVERAVVTLIRGAEVHRRTTDRSGEFEFPGIRPGVWTVRITAPLPVRHTLELDSLQVEVVGGAETRTDFRVIPIAREIRMIPIEPAVENPEELSPSGDVPQDDPEPRRSEGDPGRQIPGWMQGASTPTPGSSPQERAVTQVWNQSEGRL